MHIIRGEQERSIVLRVKLHNCALFTLRISSQATTRDLLYAVRSCAKFRGAPEPDVLRMHGLRVGPCRYSTLDALGATSGTLVRDDLYALRWTRYS